MTTLKANHVEFMRRRLTLLQRNSLHPTGAFSDAQDALPSADERHLHHHVEPRLCSSRPGAMGFSPALLAGRVCIVMGAGSPRGIGRSLVVGLAAAGARAVYATDLTLVNMASLQREVEQAGSACRVHAERLDVASEEQTVRVVKQAVAQYGRLDCYFANAGFVNFRRLQDTDAAHYDRAISVMQRPLFLAVRYGGQGMSAVSAEKPQAGGSIVVTSSMASVAGAACDFSYSSAKTAVAHMVQSASVQLSATHVRVNAVSPGLTRTSILATSEATSSGKAYGAEVAGDEAVDRLDAAKRAKSSAYYYDRSSEPEEMASIGVFLASDLSAAINGQNIVADNGKAAAALGESIIGPVMPLKPF